MPKTSAQYLDEIADLTGANSDNKIANLIGCTRQAVSNYRLCLAGFDAPISANVAAVLGIHPGIVFLDMQVQRTRDESARDVWAEIGRAFAPAIKRAERRKAAHA